MATPSTSTINMSSTSLPGMAGGLGTTTTNLETVGMGAPSTTSSLPTATQVVVNSPSVLHPTAVALLTLPSTTLTAYGVPGTTGLAVLADSGQTLTFRSEGITLSDGNVISLGFNGLVQSTTTALYSAVSGSTAVPLLISASGSSFALPTGPGPVIFNSTFPTLESSSTGVVASGLTGSQTSGGVTLTTSQSGGGGGTSGQSTGSGSDGSATQGSESASSSQAAASLSAGKAAMLLGAVGGAVALGL